MPHLIIRLSGSTLTSKLDSLGICPTHVSDLWRMCSSSWRGHNYSYSFCQRIEMTQRHHHCTNTEQLTIWWGLSNPFFHDHPAEKWLVYSKGLWFFRRTRLSERGLTRDWSVVVGPPGCAAAAADSVLLLKRKGKVNKQYSSRQVWILPSSSLLCIFIIVLMNWVCGHERIVGTQEHTTVIDNFAHYNC